MSNILDTIIAHKRTEVAEHKARTPLESLRQSPRFEHPLPSLKASIGMPERTGIIAEFKRRSPSKGLINGQSSVVEVTSAYARHGASGISVLTDEPFFGGHQRDLESATINEVPLLRKDFTIDAYQLEEARAWGAAAILLIAACLSPAEVRTLARQAHDLGLEVLLELHDESELAHLCPEVDLVGVNNRNLKTFAVDLEQSVRLAEGIGNGFVRIAESGIHSVDTLRQLKGAGFDGFLIGERFMKQPDPGQAFADFVAEMREREL